jgi:hypothetical protein
MILPVVQIIRRQMTARLMDDESEWMGKEMAVVQFDLGLLSLYRPGMTVDKP